MQWLVDTYGAEPLAVQVEPDWNLTGSLLEGAHFPVYRFFPHKTRGEGFFLAVLRKSDEEAAHGASRRPLRKERPAQVDKGMLSTAQGWLQPSSSPYHLSVENGVISAFPEQHESALSALKQRVRVLQAGTELAQIKGRDLIPSHALAMSTCLHPEAFSCYEADYEEAIAYLRKEAITLKATAPRGYLLITYRNIPLGFVKNIGNRANNLYPSEWRIRKSLS